MKTPSIENLKDLLHEFSVAMLVTRTPVGQLRARPMILVEIEPEGNILLLTDRHSSKIEEISDDNHVNVSMQSSMKFVSITGTAVVIDDRQKVGELWKESWRVWFPDGQDDPDLILLQIHGDVGEYWDNSGVSGIKYLIEAGKAYITGKRPDVSDPMIHGKVKL